MTIKDIDFNNTDEKTKQNSYRESNIKNIDTYTPSSNIINYVKEDVEMDKPKVLYYDNNRYKS